MTRFIIEREIEGASELTPEQLAEISQTSNQAVAATGTADRRRLQLRTEGVANVPPRPRASTRANPSGLTNRQLEVATLLARGLTNAEIAARLYISPKTADHHVSAVLMRMGLSNRREVIVQAEELGLA